MAKEFVVVGGPNGAGKTTFALEYAARHGLAYLSADAIATEMSPDDPAQSQIAASREFLRQIETAIGGELSLVVESTLSGRSFHRFLKRARGSQFQITIIYLFLDSADRCVERVRERVQKGGHDVPEIDIRRRFVRSVNNFWRFYRPLSDHWVLVYNSTDQPHDVAVGTNGDFTIRDADLFSRFESLLNGNS